MKKLIFLIMTLCLMAMNANAQTQTVIGSIINNTPVITVNNSTLTDAIEDELNDGTSVVNLLIDQDQLNNWYLISNSQSSTLKKTTCYLLSLSPNGDFRLSLSEISYKICSTTTCINFCDWKLCACTSGIPGQSCESAYANLSNGAGHIGSFY